MNYPILLEAYLDTQQASFLEGSQVVNSKIEADNFVARYSKCRIVVKEIDQSLDNSLNKDRTQRVKKTKAIPPKNKFSIGKVIITIMGVITGLIAIYEFILKHILKTETLF